MKEIEEGSRPGASLSGAVASAAELRAYYQRKGLMVAWSAAVALPTTLAVAVVSPYAAVALAIGVACGIANAYLVMRSNERLGAHRSVGVFVFSSMLRIFVFGIVPVELALHGPWTAMLTYFIGFFMPLGCYAALTARFIRTSSTT